MVYGTSSSWAPSILPPQKLTKATGPHGLAALALVSFSVAFFGSRLFAVLNPHTVVVTGGIHFHHFWYGLVMVIVAGWMGIVSVNPFRRRIYAILFGLGTGLIADELGLLLTFGDYFSEPTYVVFVAAVAVASVGVLLLAYRKQAGPDFLELKWGERIIYLGIVVVGLSFIGFAAGSIEFGVVVAAAGFIVVAVGVFLYRRG